MSESSSERFSKKVKLNQSDLSAQNNNSNSADEACCQACGLKFRDENSLAKHLASENHLLYLEKARKNHSITNLNSGNDKKEHDLVRYENRDEIDKQISLFQEIIFKQQTSKLDSENTKEVSRIEGDVKNIDFQICEDIAEELDFQDQQLKEKIEQFKSKLNKSKSKDTERKKANESVNIKRISDTSSSSDLEFKI